MIIASRLKSGALAAALLLGVPYEPVSAASGVNLCDRTNPVENSLTIDVTSLTLTVVDHGDAANLDATTQQDLEDSDNSMSYAIPLAPKVAAILRHIFDESDSEPAHLDQEVATGAPLAILKAPASSLLPGTLSETVSSEPASEPVTLPVNEARLPGIAEDEARRFRRQMFRTDI